MDRGKLAVVLFIVTAYTGTFAFKLSMPAVAFYAKNILEASMLGIGMLTSSFFIARATTAILAGALTDKIKTKILFLSATGFILNAFVVELYPYIASLPWLLFLRFLQGVLNGFAWVPIQAVLGLLVEKNIRGRVYSVYFILGTLGSFTGNTVYSFLTSKPLSYILGISSTLFLVSGLQVLGSKLLLREKTVLVASSDIKRNTVKKGLAGGISTVFLVLPLLLIVFTSSMFGSFLKGDLIYVYLYVFQGFSESSAPMIVGIASLLVLPINYVMSWFSDRRDSYLALRISILTGVIGGILLALRNDFIAVLGLLMALAGSSSTIPITRKLAVSIKSRAGTGIGLLNTTGNLGSMLGSAVAGYVLDSLGNMYLMGLINVAMIVIVLPMIVALFFTHNIGGKHY